MTDHDDIEETLSIYKYSPYIAAIFVAVLIWIIGFMCGFITDAVVVKLYL